MSAKHWRRTAWGLAAGMVATLGTAWGQAPGTERTCGTRGTTATPAGRSRGPEEGRGRSSPSVARASIPPRSSSRPSWKFRPAPAVRCRPPLARARPPPSRPLRPRGGTPCASGLTPRPRLKGQGQDRMGAARVSRRQAKGEIPGGASRRRRCGLRYGPERGLTAAVSPRGPHPRAEKSGGRSWRSISKAMEGTGNWGAVRVLPAPAEGWTCSSWEDREGTGKDLELSGRDRRHRRHWLQKLYKGSAAASQRVPPDHRQYSPSGRLQPHRQRPPVSATI